MKTKLMTKNTQPANKEVSSTLKSTPHAKKMLKAKEFVEEAISDMRDKNLSPTDVKTSEELLKDDLESITRERLTHEELQMARDILEEKLEGAIPSRYNQDGIQKPQVTYVFQGGGALGAYQVGAYEALRECGYAPDMIVGISIGAINAAIIAGNSRENRLDRLCQFWDRITTRIPFPAMQQFGFSKPHHWLSAQSSLIFGQPGFFKPRPIGALLKPKMTPEQISIYDTEPLRKTLLELVDFEYLNQKHVRLCVGAVNLESGEFVFFDNFEQELTVEHIMASSALPPGFPPIKIDNQYYVDGGVYSNTPMSKVIDEFAESEKEIKNVLCFMIDLFSISNVAPHSLDGILERIKDIRFSSHTIRNSKLYATTQNLSHAIHFLTSKLTPEQLQDPRVQEVVKLGFAHRLDLVHLVYKSERGTELESKDYEFSVETANKHRQMGYTSTRNMILDEEKNWMDMQKSGVTIYNQEIGISVSHKL